MAATGTHRSNSKRIIRIGGPNAPRVTPVYAIPLQTTATINIQLNFSETERTNAAKAASMGTEVPIRIGPNGSEMVPRGILKKPGGSSGTSASDGLIKPQQAVNVASRPPSKSHDKSHGKSTTTAAEVHAVAEEVDAHARGSNKGFRKNVSVGTGEASRTGVYNSHGVQTEYAGNLSDVYGKKAEAISTQVKDMELNDYGQTTSTGPNEAVYSGVSQSAGGSVNGDSETYAGSSSIKSDHVYESAESVSSQSSAKSASKVRSTAPPLKVGPAGSESPYGGSSKGGKGRKSGGQSGGSESDATYGFLDNAADPNSFRFISWDIEQEDEENLPCKRVLVMKEPDMVLMFMACCSTEAVGNDKRLLDLMVNIADSCVKRLRVLMKDKTPEAKIAGENMETLPLSDGRQTKEHLDELSAKVNETITITDVAFRFKPPEGVYLGTFVHGTVAAKRNYAIGRVGVLAVLSKKNKYATVEAFSEQLCEHIASMKPTNLGTMRGHNTKNMTKSAMAHLQDQQRDQLLLQNYLFDPTIVVAEAARRSFVKIDGFLLFR